MPFIFFFNFQKIVLREIKKHWPSGYVKGSTTHTGWYSNMVQGSTNNIPIWFKVLPMVYQYGSRFYQWYTNMVYQYGSRFYQWYTNMVQGSTNGIPIWLRVLPMIPLVIPMLPMVPLALTKLPMVQLVQLGEPRTEPVFGKINH